MTRFVGSRGRLAYGLLDLVLLSITPLPAVQQPADTARPQAAQPDRYPVVVRGEHALMDCLPDRMAVSFPIRASPSATTFLGVRLHELLLSAAAEAEEILKEPAPFVLQTSLDDYYVSYELVAHTEQPNRMAKIYSELHQRIQDKFNEAGVEIPTPHDRAAAMAIRVTLPGEYLPKGYHPPACRVQHVSAGSGAGVGRDPEKNHE